MIKDFKKFILRGSLVDLAIAVLIGAAFGALVNSLVKDLFTPLIAAVAGKPDFSNLTFTIHNSKFYYGDFLNALISFISIALVVFFFVLKPVTKLQSMTSKNKIDEEKYDEKECPECLSPIPRHAKRCKFCASVQKV